MDPLNDIGPIISKHLRDEPLSVEEDLAFQTWILSGKGRNEMLQRFKNDPASIGADLARWQQIPLARIWEMLEAHIKAAGFWQEEITANSTRASSEPGNSGPANSTPGSTAIRPTRFLHLPIHRSWQRYCAAALLILLVGSTWRALLQHKPTVQPASATTKPVPPTDIAPGTNRATLQLADGRRIDLDTSADGLLVRQGNMAITKLANGELAYKKTANSTPQTPDLNLLTTPRAGQFSLLLPDGSKVWLNNASSLRYPVAFTGDTREVELNGEAYFEIATDAIHPFLVHPTGGIAGSATVEVLGTTFNIMAYSDETTQRTTLVEGSIRYTHGLEHTLLKPEEQAALDKHGHLHTLKQVNIAEITAWKNGYFHFDHTNLETTMRQLARWYDITVSYQGNIPAQEFVGKIQRNMPLSAVLKGLEGEHIHFRLEGRHLIVMP